jgi:hypothetical protein
MIAGVVTVESTPPGAGLTTAHVRRLQGPGSRPHP